jgi:hypothetical protein
MREIAECLDADADVAAQIPAAGYDRRGLIRHLRWRLIHLGGREIGCECGCAEQA